VLALLNKPSDLALPWKTDHSVRRFIRPVLMRDPKVEDEAKKLTDQQPQLPAPQQPPAPQEPQQPKPLDQQLEDVRQERLRLQAAERRLQREQKQLRQQGGAAATGKVEPK
jgi:hypothetical protein